MNRTILRSARLAPVLLAFACASAPKGTFAVDTAGGPLDSAASDTGGTDSLPPPDPAWYAPRAVVEVVGGVMSLSQLSAQVVDSDLVTVICVIQIDATAGVAGPSPDPAATLWMDVTTTPNDMDCATLPVAFGLGIGALPADIRAQLGPSGLDGVADSLYGAFTRSPDVATTVVSAFGYAGTHDDMEGVAPAAAIPPDGEYTMNPLFLLRL